MQDFYKKVLCGAGIYCLTTIDRQEPDEKKKARNHFANDQDELFSLIEQWGDVGLDVFIALSSFTEHTRKAAYASHCRCFFLDLDVGVDVKKYQTKAEALVGLQDFLKLSGLPPPSVIDSGTGYHTYWIFDEDVPIEIWKGFAEKFKAYCRDKIKFDPVVTADTARIMRCPTTWNHKTEPPSLVQIISNEGPYDFREFKNFLGDDIKLENILKSIPKGLDEDTAAIKKSSNFESVFQIIVQKSLAGRGCNQIRNIVENAATMSEPLWHAGLSIAQHCVDRDWAIHAMSEDHPGYKFELTEKKANATQDKPQSCLTFENKNPGGCTQCELRGKITNPLALGQQLKELPIVVAIAENKFRLPDDMKPFISGAHGGIYMIQPDEKTEEGASIVQKPLLVSEHDIYPIKRIYHREEGACLLMRYVIPKDPMREFPIPTGLFHKLNELTELVSKQELSFSPHTKARYFMEYMIKWGQHMLNANAAEQMRMQMGWTEDLNGFVIGNAEYTRSGEISRTASSPLVHSISRLLKTQGSYDLWKQAAKKLDQKGFEIHAFVMLCAFGSPLMRMTSTAGISVGLVGGSGYGKTGALYAGLSLFGNPKELCLAGGKEQATSNGLIGWFMGLKNIMLGLDESSNRKPEELSNLIHQVAQGKGKIRMQASVNAVRDLELSASLITVFTENQAIYDKLSQLKASPDGEMARMVEMTLHRPKAMDKNPDLGKEIFDVFRTNYGFAGPEYIQALFQHGETGVRDLINKWIIRFGKVFGQDTTYRFYENLIGVAFAGGEIANLAGITDFDLDKIFVVIAENLSGIKKDAPINELDFENILGEFQNKFIHGTLFVDKNQVIGEPKQAIVARAEINTKMYYVSTREIKKYLHEIQVGLREFLSVMRDKGILTYEGKQRLTNNWAGVISTPISVYGFLYEPPKGVLAQVIK